MYHSRSQWRMTISFYLQAGWRYRFFWIEESLTSHHIDIFVDKLDLVNPINSLLGKVASVVLSDQLYKYFLIWIFY